MDTILDIIKKMEQLLIVLLAMKVVNLIIGSLLNFVKTMILSCIL
jgi:hypothetical protein